MRIFEEVTKYIVRDVTSVIEKVGEEGDLVGKMYFAPEELLSLPNLEFDSLDVILAKVEYSQS